MDFSLLLSLGGEDFFAGHYWSWILDWSDTASIQGLVSEYLDWEESWREKRIVCDERNWINIRPKSGVILVWDLPKVDADTQLATSDILR